MLVDHFNRKPAIVQDQELPEPILEAWVLVSRSQTAFFRFYK